MNTTIFSAIKAYKDRVFGYDAETRIAFFVLLTALVSTTLCAVAVFAFAIYLLIKKYGSLYLKKENRLSTVFGCLLLVVSAVYLNYLGVLAAAFLICAMLIAFCFKQNITKQKVEDIFTLMIAYSPIAFIIAVIQKILDLSAISGRSESTFLNALFYCYYLGFVILICFYRVLFVKKQVGLHLSLMILNILAIIVTASKMPLLSVAIACGVMLLLAKRYKLFALFLSVGVLGVVVLLFFGDTILEKLDMNGFLKSFEDRFPYWQQAIDGFVEKPVFGHGLLGFLKETIDNSVLGADYSFELSNVNKSFDGLKGAGWHLHAHSVLLDCLYNYGTVGTVMFFAIVIKRVRHLYVTVGKKVLEPIMILVICFLVNVLIGGLVDCQFIGVQTFFISIIMLSVTAIYDNEIKTDWSCKI